MGGFHLLEYNSKEMSNDNWCMPQEDEPLHLLGASHLLNYAKSFIMPMKAEINNKGKSNWFAKSLILLQTSWFMMQCIACAIKCLPVTHLEIVMLAYAAMNFVVYIFWWSKPLNINQPVQVFQKSELKETQPQVNDLELISEVWILTWKAINNGLKKY